MIQATIFRNQNGQYVGFDCIGHAGYAAAGEDMVCAGVSALVFNTVNAIDRFTEEVFTAETKEETGEISVRFRSPVSHDAQLLIDALLLGLQGIQQQYKTTYITLNFKEV